MIILFIILPSYSHINAVLNLAKEESKINIVYFLGSPITKFNNYIREQGFFVIDCTAIPFGMSYSDELAFYRYQNYGFSELLKNRISGGIITFRTDEVVKILGKHNIQKIYLDSFIGADFLCYYDYILKKGIDFSYITTMNPLIHFKKSFKLTSSSLHLDSINKDGVLYIWQCFYLMGRTTSRLIDTLMVNYNFSCDRLKLYGKCGIIFSGYPEIILAERDMLPCDIPDAIVAGSQIDINRLEHVFTSDRDVLKEVFKSGSQIIYVSIGTLYDSSYFKIIIAQIITVANQLKSFSFIIANVHNEKIELNNSKLRSMNNIYFVHLAPQLLILSKTSIFITHGGFNSLKEAIHFGIPTIIVPSSNNFDQDLAKYLTWVCKNGKVIERKEISAANIITAISDLLNL